MSEALLLKITTNDGNIRIISKNRGDVSIKTIELKLLMAHCWWAELPALETFFEVFEGMIKNAISDVYNHESLIINYNYKANDTLEDATKIEIEIEGLTADGKEFDIIGRFITLEGEDRRGFLKKISSFRRKTEEHIHKKL